MAEAWPTGVRYEPLSGSMDVPDPYRAPLQTEMDDGSDWRRPSTTLIVARVSFSIRMPNSEIAAFKLWVRRTLVQGTLPFTMPVWTGAAYETKTCTLVRPPGINPASGDDDGVVSLTLDVQDW